MDLESRARAVGVETGYEDYEGEYRRSPEESVLAVVEALEEDSPRGPEDQGPLVLRRGAPLPFDGPALVDTDTGDELRVEGIVPAAMPFGYHTIRGPGDVPRRLIVSPGTCHLPENLRTWGWAAQLYAVRSSNSWGIGDLADLEELARWSAASGAGLVMVNPLGAVTPGRAIQPSPYYPSSRSFRNPLYLSVDRIPGHDDPGIEYFREAGRTLNRAPLINRDSVWAAKGPALELLYTRFEGHPEFDRFCEDHGRSLDDFAIFCALAEVYEGTSQDWPEALRHPGTAEVTEFRAYHHPRVRFHKWLQWQLENQLTDAGRHLGLLQDLPVGVDPSGADAWMWGDAFAEGFELGAPPDQFNRAGQCWGIAGFHPKRLRAAGYEPFIQMIRSALAHSGGMRIDHVMGLFRLYWILGGCEASEGVYVRYPSRELLDIVALESRRAGAFIVGEDLGTVEPMVREEMAARRMLSYRLMIFEDDLAAIPGDSMAAATTHDLPTLPGIWTGADLKAQRNLGLPANVDGMEEMRRRIAKAAGVGEDAPVPEVVAAAYRRLAGCPARIVLGMLEDVVGATDRANMPGTSERWPNWSIPLPKSLEQIRQHPDVGRVIDELRRSESLPDGQPDNPSHQEN